MIALKKIVDRKEMWEKLVEAIFRIHGQYSEKPWNMGLPVFALNPYFIFILLGLLVRSFIFFSFFICLSLSISLSSFIFLFLSL